MRRRLLSLGALTVGLALLVAMPTVAGAKGKNLLEFQSMTGVPKALTGSALPQRGLNGGGLPWVIASGQGELSTSGHVEVRFSGLVLDPSDPAVIASGNAGKNPIPSMKVIVSCLATDGSVHNVSTDPFPVTTGVGEGDGQVEADLTLPDPCIAPLVFITSTGSAWFAVTGG